MDNDTIIEGLWTLLLECRAAYNAVPAKDTTGVDKAQAALNSLWGEVYYDKAEMTAAILAVTGWTDQELYDKGSYIRTWSEAASPWSTWGDETEEYSERVSSPVVALSRMEAPLQEKVRAMIKNVPKGTPGAVECRLFAVDFDERYSTLAKAVDAANRDADRAHYEIEAATFEPLRKALSDLPGFVTRGGSILSRYLDGNFGVVIHARMYHDNLAVDISDIEGEGCYADEYRFLNMDKTRFRKMFRTEEEIVTLLKSYAEKELIRRAAAQAEAEKKAKLEAEEEQQRKARWEAKRLFEEARTAALTRKLKERGVNNPDFRKIVTDLRAAGWADERIIKYLRYQETEYDGRYQAIPEAYMHVSGNRRHSSWILLRNNTACTASGERGTMYVRKTDRASALAYFAKHST